MLGRREIAFYREHGYLVLERRVSRAALGDARTALARLVTGARGVAASDDVYDLEDSHRPDAPRVRRIKQPHARDPAFDALLRSDAVLAPARDLLGASVRLHNSKLNLKSAGHGAAVDWHQDWAFYPHTNDDMLAAGVMLDDVGPDNAPLLVLPGSHLGPVHDHHSGGRFCGAIDAAASGLDAGRAVALTGPAGSISLHHVRLVHGSAENSSPRDRALLLFELAAGDAWPLARTGHLFSTLEEYDSRLLCGAPAIAPRLAAVPVRMPEPPAAREGSIYENQKGAASHRPLPGRGPRRQGGRPGGGAGC